MNKKQASAAMIITAIKYNDLCEVNNLLEENPELINVKDENNESLLHHAVISQGKEIVELLIEKNIDVNYKNDDKITVLGNEIMSNYSYLTERKDILSLLIKHSDLSKKQGDFLFSYLKIAIKNSDLYLIERLIKEGAIIETNSLYYSITQAHDYQSENSLGVFKLLVSLGADINTMVTDINLIDMTVYKNNPEIFKFLYDKGLRQDKTSITSITNNIDIKSVMWNNIVNGLNV